MKKSQMISGALGMLIIGGALGFGGGRLSQAFVVREIGQEDLMQSYALLNESRHALSHGHHAVAQIWSSESTAYLASAVTPLKHLGITEASTVYGYLQTAQYDFVMGHASAHQKLVLRDFQQSLAPFAHQNYGTISDTRLHAAFKRIQAAITK